MSMPKCDPNVSRSVYSLTYKKLVALHRFTTDGPIWVVFLNKHTDDWVTLREATQEDLVSFKKEGLMR